MKHPVFSLFFFVYVGFCWFTGPLFSIDTYGGTQKEDTSSWNLYLYVPVRLVPGPKAIQKCLSLKKYQVARLQVFPSTISYHISLGNYAIEGRSNAEALAQKIQGVVAKKFSKFSAKLDQGHGGVSVFGGEPKKFIVMVLKTAHRGKNRQKKVLFTIHDCIQKIALASGAFKIGTVPFVPHCSISSFPGTELTNFLKVKKSLIRQLTKIARREKINVNPHQLRYKLFPN